MIWKWNWNRGTRQKNRHTPNAMWAKKNNKYEWMTTEHIEAQTATAWQCCVYDTMSASCICGYDYLWCDNVSALAEMQRLDFYLVGQSARTRIWSCAGTTRIQFFRCCWCVLDAFAFTGNINAMAVSYDARCTCTQRAECSILLLMIQNNNKMIAVVVVHFLECVAQTAIAVPLYARTAHRSFRQK